MIYTLDFPEERMARVAEFRAQLIADRPESRDLSDMLNDWVMVPGVGMLRMRNCTGMQIRESLEWLAQVKRQADTNRFESRTPLTALSADIDAFVASGGTEMSPGLVAYLHEPFAQASSTDDELYLAWNAADRRHIALAEAVLERTGTGEEAKA